MELCLMPRFKIAHLHEQGQDMIIVPLDTNFAHTSQQDKEAAVGELQAHANGAGLRGRVVAVWDDGGGRMGFIAPVQWHPFFSSLDLGRVWACLNRELYW
jgi:hypothetical protein